MDGLEASHAFCRSVVRGAHSNFTAAFRFLPREQRRAMTAVYAFLRIADDLADGAAPIPDRVAELGRFGDDFRHALSEGADPENAHCPASVFPAVRDAMGRFGIPETLFALALEGVSRDLAVQRLQTRAELEDYCFHVASVVGLMCLHIWGVPVSQLQSGTEVHAAAVACGQALQWTNILRDVREDALAGRVYLPLEDFAGVGIPPGEVRDAILKRRPQVIPVLEKNLRVARELFARTVPLEATISGPGRKVWRVLVGKYFMIWRRMEADPGRVLDGRLRPGVLENLRVLFCRRAFWG